MLLLLQLSFGSHHRAMFQSGSFFLCSHLDELFDILSPAGHSPFASTIRFLTGATALERPPWSASTRESNLWFE
jgi:hypothetical protein